jgi:Flp pilus assembly protein TadG
VLKRHRDERGSVLILMPAAVLIVLLLGAVAVDLTVVHLRQQQAIEAAASAANDAVTAGVDQAALRAGRGYTLDPDRVRAAVDQSLRAQGLTDRLAAPPQIDEPTPRSVTVVITLRADYLFARSLPGGPHGTTVRGTATATAQLAPD